MKNIYNCVVNLESYNERMGLLVSLHLLGYKVLGFENLKGLHHMVMLNKSVIVDDYMVNVGGCDGMDKDWVNKINKHKGEPNYYKNEFIFCENIEIFEAIAAINNETDYWQWFNFTLNEKVFWIKSVSENIETQIYGKKALKTLKKSNR